MTQRKKKFKFNLNIWTVTQKTDMPINLLIVLWYIFQCIILRQSIMHSAINISLECCTVYLNKVLCYAYKDFCKLQNFLIREILAHYKLKNTICFFGNLLWLGPHPQCNEIRLLFTLPFLLQTMNQKGFWVGLNTRRMHQKISVL